MPIAPIHLLDLLDVRNQITFPLAEESAHFWQPSRAMSIARIHLAPSSQEPAHIFITVPTVRMQLIFLLRAPRNCVLALISHLISSCQEADHSSISNLT